LGFTYLSCNSPLQAHLNWSRKSTSGFCIYNILLDLTGGVFSILQMIIIGYNHSAKNYLSILSLTFGMRSLYWFNLYYRRLAGSAHGFYEVRIRVHFNLLRLSFHHPALLSLQVNNNHSLIADLCNSNSSKFSYSCFVLIFRNHEAYEPIEGSNTPADPYEDMVTSNQSLQDGDLETLSQSTTTSSSSSRKFFPPPSGSPWT